MSKIRKYAIWVNKEWDLDLYGRRNLALKDCPVIDVLYLFKIERKFPNGTYIGYIIDTDKITPKTVGAEELMSFPEQLCL